MATSMVIGTLGVDNHRVRRWPFSTFNNRETLGFYVAGFCGFTDLRISKNTQIGKKRIRNMSLRRSYIESSGLTGVGILDKVVEFDQSRVSTGDQSEKCQFHKFLKLPAEIRCMVYDELFDVEGVKTIRPGSYESDEHDPLLQRYAFSEASAGEQAFRLRPNFTADYLMPNHDYIFPTHVQALSILLVSKKVRNEAAYVLFRSRLEFPRIYDYPCRIGRFLPCLPPLYKDSIQKLSIDISMNADMTKTYGNTIIPYMPLCVNLNFVELHFSLRFYRDLVYSRLMETKQSIFAKLMKLLICLLNLNIKGMKVSIANAYKHGDEYVQNFRFVTETLTDIPDDLELVDPSPKNKKLLRHKGMETEYYPKFRNDVEVPSDMEQKINLFNETFEKLFLQAAQHRDAVFALPFVQKQLQNPIYQPAYQFYESSAEEKAAQLNMEIEPFLQVKWPKDLDECTKEIPENVKCKYDPKWKDNCILVDWMKELGLDAYDTWLCLKYRIPKMMGQIEWQEECVKKAEALEQEANQEKNEIEEGESNEEESNGKESNEEDINEKESKEEESNEEENNGEKTSKSKVSKNPPTEVLGTEIQKKQLFN